MDYRISHIGLLSVAFTKSSKALEQFPWSRATRDIIQGICYKLQHLSFALSNPDPQGEALILRFFTLAISLDEFLSRFLRTRELNDDVTPHKLIPLRASLSEWKSHVENARTSLAASQPQLFPYDACSLASELSPHVKDLTRVINGFADEGQFILFLSIV